MSTEITNNQEFEHFAIEYAVRFTHCKPFTVNDIYQHALSMNKKVLEYKLEDLVIAKKLTKRGETLFQGIDTRDDKQRVMSAFSNQYEWLSIPQIEQMLKMRETTVKAAIQELVNDGVIEKCPFIGGSYWLRIEPTNN